MLYSRAHKFVFSQLSRSGSSSTGLALRRYCGPAFVPQTPSIPEINSTHGVIGAIQPLDDKIVPPRFWVHMPLSQMRRALGTEIWDRCDIVSNIRNPFARIVSFLHVHMRQGYLPQSDDIDTARANLAALDIEFVAQRTLEMTHIDGEFALRTVLPNETLDRDLPLWAERTGLPNFPAQRERLQSNTNAFANRPAADFLTAPIIAKVRDQFGWMFDRFGYSVHPEDAHLPPQNVPAIAQEATA